jgi:hypothetical protein
VDARPVLFGRPLLEHLAHGILTASGGIHDEAREQERTRAIHAEWLLTARADLSGRTPRELLLAERNRLALDLEHRAQQWSRQRHPVPPLPADALAYQRGGFGTMEVCFYFDLVRALLAEGWRLTQQEPRPTPALLVERLAEFRDRWVGEPNEATSLFLSPQQLIELERRRMPVTSDGSHLDCDCPICQALAEEEDFGPAFLCFDGHHLELENEFAFSLCATREEWDREQEEYRRFAEEMDRKTSERSAAGPDADPLAGSVWQSTFVDWQDWADPHTSPREALLALGFPLAEVVGELQGRPNGVDLLRSLNASYAGLRTSQDAVAADSAAQEFRELLEEVSRQFPDLTPRCADLQSRLDEVLRRIF